MQTKNNFSSSVSFNIFYLAEPNKSVTHTHTHSFLNSQKDNVMMVSCTRVHDTIMYARGYCSFLLLFYLFKNYCFLIQYLFFNQLGK